MCGRNLRKERRDAKIWPKDSPRQGKNLFICWFLEIYTAFGTYQNARTGKHLALSIPPLEIWDHTCVCVGGWGEVRG